MSLSHCLSFVDVVSCAVIDPTDEKCKYIEIDDRRTKGDRTLQRMTRQHNGTLHHFVLLVDTRRSNIVQVSMQDERFDELYFIDEQHIVETRHVD
jgi:hypothetical protein